MDWSKAKNILIIALIITNILLFADLMLVKEEIELFDDNVINDTLSILNERDIYVYAQISTEQKYLPVLEVEYDEITDEDIQHIINNQEDIRTLGISREQTVEKVERFLRENGLEDEDMVLQEPIKYENNQYILTYKKYYNNIALEECHMTVIAEDGVIVNIDRIWLNAIGKGKMAKKTIPVTTALLRFASNLPSDAEKPIIITDIEAAYWLKTSAYDQEITRQDTALPAWKITYNKNIDYILAYED
ncbi:MAG: hypothetical protein WC996_06985 [Peptostreptococcales bacterium]